MQRLVGAAENGFDHAGDSFGYLSSALPGGGRSLGQRCVKDGRHARPHAGRHQNPAFGRREPADVAEKSAEPGADLGNRPLAAP